MTKIEQRELNKRRGKGKTYTFVYSVMKNNKSLRNEEVNKIKIKIKGTN